MALFDRLAGNEEPKISPHFLYALLRELARSEVTKPDIVSMLELSAGDESDLDWLITQYQAQTVGLDREQWFKDCGV